VDGKTQVNNVWNNLINVPSTMQANLLIDRITSRTFNEIVHLKKRFIDGSKEVKETGYVV